MTNLNSFKKATIQIASDWEKIFTICKMLNECPQFIKHFCESIRKKTTQLKKTNGQRIWTGIHRKRAEQPTDLLVGVRDVHINTFHVPQIGNNCKIGQVQVLVRCGAPGAHPEGLVNRNKHLGGQLEGASSSWAAHDPRCSSATAERLQCSPRCRYRTVSRRR